MNRPLLWKTAVVVRRVGVWALAGVVCAAQAGPPVCPVAARKTAASMRPRAARPSGAAPRATAGAAAADPSVLVAAEPMENFGVARYRLEDYADCVGRRGCWADVDAQAKRAEIALNGLVAKRKAGERLAPVLDIDETSLSNYCEMKREDYGFLLQMFNVWEVSSEADMALPGTLRLFNRARAAGVEVFFIAGRPGDQRAATTKNLEAAGVQGVEGTESSRRAAEEYGYRRV